jgi:hypothetical protein
MNTRKLLARTALCSALAFTALTTLPAAAQTYTKQQLQETYSAYLAAEGYRPDVTPSGNVRFRRESKVYVIYVDDRDPTFFRLVLSFAAEDKSPAMRAKRLEGVNTATGDTKVIKAYLDNDGDPTFAAEMFLVVPGDFKTTVQRLFRAMDSAYEKYSAKVAAS